MGCLSSKEHSNRYSKLLHATAPKPLRYQKQQTLEAADSAVPEACKTAALVFAGATDVSTAVEALRRSACPADSARQAENTAMARSLRIRYAGYCRRNADDLSTKSRLLRPAMRGSPYLSDSSRGSGNCSVYNKGSLRRTAR